MPRIRLLHPFLCGHQELPAGLVIGIDDAAIARRLVLVELAEYTAADWGTEHAVVAPQETRRALEYAGTQDFPIIKPRRPRGRPKKNAEVTNGDRLPAVED